MVRSNSERDFGVEEATSLSRGYPLILLRATFDLADHVLGSHRPECQLDLFFGLLHRFLFSSSFIPARNDLIFGGAMIFFSLRRSLTVALKTIVDACTTRWKHTPWRLTGHPVDLATIHRFLPSDTPAKYYFILFFNSHVSLVKILFFHWYLL